MSRPPGSRASKRHRGVRALYDKMAPSYDRRIRLVDRFLFEEGRRWLGAEAAGQTLEVGVGTGLSLPFYGHNSRVTGVDMSSAMLEIAAQRRAGPGLVVRLVQGDAEALPFRAASFDTVVFSLTLCTVPDDGRAVAEALRVVRQGGRVLLLEHVRSDLFSVRLVQRLLDPLFQHFQADHLLRDPVKQLRRAGLSIETVKRSRWGIVARAAGRKALNAHRGP